MRATTERRLVTPGLFRLEPGVYCLTRIMWTPLHERGGR